MNLLGWFAMSLCLCVNAETNAVWRDSGDNVTLGCSSCDKGYDGMYLYLYREHKPRIQVVYYPDSGDETTPGDAFIERIQTNGSLSKHTVTISTLSVNDSGFYKCVYVTFPSGETSCSNYILFVRGVAPCPCPLGYDKSPCRVFIIVAAFTACMLVTIPFILLVISRVRRWSSSRRVPGPLSNDNVYEVMSPAREELPPGPCASA
ncbi:uncharacterized protein LOC120825102 isoform X2 [Gasterosteus aculeatus]